MKYEFRTVFSSFILPASTKMHDPHNILILTSLLGADSPLTHSPFGTETSLKSITAKDLDAFRAAFNDVQPHDGDVRAELAVELLRGQAQLCIQGRAGGFVVWS